MGYRTCVALTSVTNSYPKSGQVATISNDRLLVEVGCGGVDVDYGVSKPTAMEVTFVYFRNGFSMATRAGSSTNGCRVLAKNETAVSEIASKTSGSADYLDVSSVDSCSPKVLGAIMGNIISVDVGVVRVVAD